MLKKTKNFLSNPKVLFAIIIGMAIVAMITKYRHPGSYNNFNTFTSGFDNLIAQTSLYASDSLVYLYGVVFAVLIAPFAILPIWLGLLLWIVISVIGLFWAIRSLPLNQSQFVIIFWLIVNELYTSTANFQYNILITAFIFGSFALIEKKKDIWATLLIAIGGFTKIIGFGALAFFLFSKKKKIFILTFLMWCGVLFVLPMFFSSVDFVLHSYQEWLDRLLLKTDSNMFSNMQNISLVGMIRKISGNPNYSDLPITAVGLLLFALPFLRTKLYENLNFRVLALASVANFIVLFNNGSESSSYILAFSGVILWYFYTPTKTAKLNLGLLIFALILTSLSLTDLVPRFVRDIYIRPYALKALPCAIIWFKIVGEMLFCKFDTLITEKKIKKNLTTADIDIVLPCYNPPVNWFNNLKNEIEKITKKFPLHFFRVIIVNDGSTKNVDDVKELIANTPNIQLIEYPTNQGKGVALRVGVNATTAPIIIYSDIDFPFQTEAIYEMITKLEHNDSDIVLACRNKTYRQQLSLTRKVLSTLSYFLNWFILGLKYPDAQGGLKGFNEMGKTIFLKTTIKQFLFDTEFIYLASQHKKIKISKVDAHLKNNIHLPNMGLKVIKNEFINFSNIIFNR